MSKIQIQDLTPIISQSISGADLFDDSENFLIEITDETDKIIGGDLWCGNTDPKCYVV
jgi:hypothetical protein